jgi:hypothetical protein
MLRSLKSPQQFVDAAKFDGFIALAVTRRWRVGLSSIRAVDPDPKGGVKHWDPAAFLSPLAAADDPAQLFLGQLDFAVLGRGGQVVASCWFVAHRSSLLGLSDSRAK